MSPPPDRAPRHSGRPARPGGGGAAPEQGRQGSLARVLGLGEDPLLWSFPIGRVMGASFRVHALVPVWMLAEAVNSLRTDRNALTHVAPAIGMLMLVALVRELARVAAARTTASPVESVVLWPLGALALRSEGPMLDRRSHLAPGLVTLALAAIFGGGVLLAGGLAEYLVFNPLAPQAVIVSLTSPSEVVLWWGYFAALLIGVANLAGPILPLDLGRAMDAAASHPRRARWARSACAKAQLFLAGALFLVLAVMDQTRAIAASAVAFVACWVAFRRSEPPAIWASSPRPARTDPPAPPPPSEALPSSSRRLPVSSTQAPVKPSIPPPQPRPDPAQEVDRVLDKVARQGLASLDEAERAVLDRETARLRRRD